MLRIVDLHHGVRLGAHLRRAPLAGCAEAVARPYRALKSRPHDGPLLTRRAGHIGVGGVGGQGLGGGRFELSTTGASVSKLGGALLVRVDGDHGKGLRLLCLAGAAEVVVLAAGAFIAHTDDRLHVALIAAHALVHRGLHHAHVRTALEFLFSFHLPVLHQRGISGSVEAGHHVVIAIVDAPQPVLGVSSEYKRPILHLEGFLLRELVQAGELGSYRASDLVAILWRLLFSC